jgi:hypothetical protein
MHVSGFKRPGFLPEKKFKKPTWGVLGTLQCLILLNSALKFHLKLKLLNFPNQKKKFPKTQVDGGISPHVKFIPG